MPSDRLTPTVEREIRQYVSDGDIVTAEEARALLRELDLMRADETARLMALASRPVPVEGPGFRLWITRDGWVRVPIPEYSYSTNGEDYVGGFGCREDALAEGVDAARCNDCTTVWTGASVPYVPTMSNAPVIEWLQEAAYDALGEHSEGWLDDATTADEADLSRRLDVALGEWLAAHKFAPTFYGVTDATEHAVTPEATNAD